MAACHPVECVGENTENHHMHISTRNLRCSKSVSRSLEIILCTELRILVF